MLRKTANGKKKSSDAWSGGCLMLFGLPFLAGGLAVAVLYFSGLVDWWLARTWVETPCRIVSAELKVDTGDDSTSYEARGRYVYEWGGRKYQSERVSLVSGSDNLGDYHQQVYGEMERALREREGASVCHVNPRDPEEAVMMRELRISQMAFFTIFCLLFPLVGAGVMGAGWWTSRNHRVEKKLREAYPDVPWRWNAAWNASPIPESAWRTGRVLVMVSVWWAVVTVPLLLAGVVDGAFSRAEAWWMLIPGGFFAGAAWMVSRRVREWGRIGRMALDVELPLRPGREIRGAWVTDKALRPHDMPVLKFICSKSVTTRSGSESTTNTDTIWEKEECLSVMNQTREISFYRLPFRFQLPTDVEETTFEDGASTKYEWKLEFRVPGTPVKAVFEVPVCRDPNEPVPERITQDVESMAADAEARLPDLLEKAKLQAVFDAGGNLQTLACGPRRLLGLIVFLLVFNTIWTGAAVFLWVSDAPAIFKMVWPLSAAGIWVMVFYQMMSRRELKLENREAHVIHKLLVYRTSVVVPATQIAKVSHGTNSSMNGKPFYWVQIEPREGKKITVASGIAGEPAALGLVRHLERWRKSGQAGGRHPAGRLTRESEWSA